MGWEYSLSVAAIWRDLREIDAENGEGCIDFVFGGDIEENMVAGGDCNPRIVLQFFFKLAGIPAGVAEGDKALARTAIPSNGIENV
jgi:hypothetical protein